MRSGAEWWGLRSGAERCGVTTHVYSAAGTRAGCGRGPGLRDRGCWLMSCEAEDRQGAKRKDPDDGDLLQKKKLLTDKSSY